MAIRTKNSTKTTRNSRKQLERRNSNAIISQAADENLGKYKALTQNKKLKTCNNETKLIVEQK